MKEYLKYLKGIHKDTFCLAWEKLGIWGTLFAFAPSIVVQVLTTPKPITCEKIIGGNWKMSIFAFITVVGVTYLIFFAIVASEKYNKKEAKLKKLEESIKTLKAKKNPTWRNIKFVKWNKRLSYSKVQGGIIIENNKNDILEDCKVKIIEIYAESGMAYYKETQSGLSITAGWETDDIVSYNETYITQKDSLRVALTFCDDSGMFQSFYIGGKNDFRHILMGNETCFVKIQVLGKINGVKLIPLIKFVTAHFDGNKFTIKDISNDLTKKQE